LHVSWYETSVQGRGVGTEMISRAIETVGPQRVSSVSAELGRTNLSVFEQVTASGVARQEAIWQTPLGKSMNSLGYRNVEFGFGNSVKFVR
jgi:filamentous hemagglutinin